MSKTPPIPQAGQLEFSGTWDRQQRAGMSDSNPCFFALKFSAADASVVESFAAGFMRAHGLTGSITRPELMHVTLNSIHLPDNRVAAAAREAAATIRHPPVALTFDRICGFGRGHGKLVLAESRPFGGAVALASLIAEKMRRRHFRVGCGATTPHLTFLYDGRPIAEVRLEHPLVFTLQEFVLVRSWHGQARHECLGRPWPLDATTPVDEPILRLAL